MTISGVDLDLARQHLEQANKHVSEGQKRTDAQIALVARLERDGHDTRQTRALLEQFEQTLALQIETRAHIIQELSDEDNSTSVGGSQRFLRQHL